MKMPEESLRRIEQMVSGMSYWIPALITGDCDDRICALAEAVSFPATGPDASSAG